MPEPAPLPSTPLALEGPTTVVSPAQVDDGELARLEALGYLSGYVEPPAQRSVTVHDPERAHPGLNFFSSAHRPSSFLIDMEGNVLHEWTRPLEEVWPGSDFEGVKHTRFWRRAHPFPNGDLLVVFENIGIAKLDAGSRLLWARDNGAHHDLEVLENGDIWVLTSRLTRFPELSDEVPVREDFLVLLDTDGRTKREISLIEAITTSRFFPRVREPMLSGHRPDADEYDIFHTNTLAVLDGRAEHVRPEFAAGNILTSFRSLDMIAVIDAGSERATWAYRGRFRRQHDPKILENANLLLFDNSGGGKHSAVLEYDLETMKIVWSHTGTADAPFFSVGSGAAQRLPNGNTLVTETMRGRAFEVTPANEIVWEFHNPHLVGKDDALIAGIWELFRLDETTPPAWARAPAQ